MTDDQWAKLKPLSEAVERATLAVIVAETTNMRRDARERLDAAVRLRRLKTEAYIANCALTDAYGSMA